eukprot:scaffold88852_cov17-Tisochrysis_lutea.AAC.1
MPAFGSVTLGDEEAKRTNQGQKVKLVRKGPPVFDILIEVLPDYRSSEAAQQQHVDLYKLIGAKA